MGEDDGESRSRQVRRRFFVRASIFIGLAAIAQASAALPPGPDNLALYWASLAVFVACALTVLLPWQRFPALGHSRSDDRVSRLGHPALDLGRHGSESAEHVRWAFGPDPPARPRHGAVLPQHLYGHRRRCLHGQPDGSRRGRADQRGDGPPPPLRVDGSGSRGRGDGPSPSYAASRGRCGTRPSSPASVVSCITPPSP